MDIELLYFDGCPHWETADARLHEVATRHHLTVRRRRVTRPAEEPAFAGSPTILVDGRDPFGATGTAAEDPGVSSSTTSPGLACRLYETPGGTAGSPTVDQLEAALADASRS